MSAPPSVRALRVSRRAGFRLVALRPGAHGIALRAERDPQQTV